MLTRRPIRHLLRHATTYNRHYSTSLPSSPAHFDTYQFVQDLEATGLTRQQCESVLDSVRDAIHQSSQPLLQDRVTQDQQLKVSAMYRVDLAQLRSEVQMLERTDFAQLKTETQRLSVEVEKLQQRLREDIGRLQASTRLDFNLEKGRGYDEQRELVGKLKAIEAQLEQELGQLRANLDMVNYDTYRTLLATASTVGLIVLGFLRLVK